MTEVRCDQLDPNIYERCYISEYTNKYNVPASKQPTHFCKQKLSNGFDQIKYFRKKVGA